MIGLGLVVEEKFFRRRRRRRRRHLGVDPKKLGFCIKNIEYRHSFSRVCCLGKKRRLTKDDGQVFKKSGGHFFGKKNTGGLTEDAGQVLLRTPSPKMSRTPCPVEDPMS